MLAKVIAMVCIKWQYSFRFVKGVKFFACYVVHKKFKQAKIAILLIFNLDFSCSPNKYRKAVKLIKCHRAKFETSTLYYSVETFAQSKCLHKPGLC